MFSAIVNNKVFWDRRREELERKERGRVGRWSCCFVVVLLMFVVVVVGALSFSVSYGR